VPQPAGPPRTFADNVGVLSAYVAKGAP